MAEKLVEGYIVFVKHRLLSLAALILGLAVAAGAFAAHGLKAHLSAEAMAWWQTAVQYQMLHGLALLALALYQLHIPAPSVQQSRRIAWALLLGIMLFSGSLYGLALTGWRKLGMITPLGGTAFLFAWGYWAWLAVTLAKQPASDAAAP